MTQERQGPAPLGAYAQTITAAGLCFVSGQIPVDHEGNLASPDDLTGQAEQVFRNLKGCLADAGLAMSDLVSLTTYLRTIDDAPEISAVRAKFLDGHRPTSTVLESPGFLDPAWRLEVQAIAAAREPDQQ